jgi:hypothetical protein
VTEKYPTLHALGLGPQLDELERICAESAAGKHAGEPVASRGAKHHCRKAFGHLWLAAVTVVDTETGALHLIHVAARSLMAAHCVEAGK